MRKQRSKPTDLVAGVGAVGIYLLFELISIAQVLISADGSIFHPRAHYFIDSYNRILVCITSALFLITSSGSFSLIFLSYYRSFSAGIAEARRRSFNFLPISVLWLVLFILNTFVAISIRGNFSDRFIGMGAGSNLIIIFFPVVSYIFILNSRRLLPSIGIFILSAASIFFVGTRSSVIFLMAAFMLRWVKRVNVLHIVVFGGMVAAVYLELLFLRNTSSDSSEIYVSLLAQNLGYIWSGHIHVDSLSYVSDVLLPYISKFVTGGGMKIGEEVANAMDPVLFYYSQSQVPIGLLGELYLLGGVFVAVIIPPFIYAIVVPAIFATSRFIGLPRAGFVLFSVLTFYIIQRNGLSYHGQVTVPFFGTALVVAIYRWLISPASTDHRVTTKMRGRARRSAI